MSIQLFVPTFEVEECLNEIRECLEKGWTGLGFKTVQIEEKWKEYTGLKNAHFLNSATAGLHLAVQILKEDGNWQEGDEIISTPLTFVSTNHAVLYEGLHVCFADVDKYLCLDPVDVEKKITDKTKAVIFVGLGGNTGQYEKVAALCRQRGIKLILDAAHMAGTRLHGEIPGKDADVIVYSFQAVKNLPTADAGMICFREERLDKIVRKKAWLGIDKDTFARTSGQGTYKWKYGVEYAGYKYHGNSIIAGIALVQLRYLDRDNAYRRQIASWYDSFFANAKGVKMIPIAEHCESSRHLYQLEVEKRDELMLALNNVDIYPGVHYANNINYPMYEYAKDTCANAMYFSEHLISLPLHLRMTRKDVERVAKAVIESIGK